MKKWLLPKIVAFLALFGIVIGIGWTAMLFILSPKWQIENNNSEMKLTPDQLKQLQELTWTWVKTATWTTTWTWETK